MGRAVSVLGREDLEEALSEENLDRRLIVTPLLTRVKSDAERSTCASVRSSCCCAGLVMPACAWDWSPNKRSMRRRSVLWCRLMRKLWLHPRHFVLAATLEFIGLPDDMSAYVVGRSSWGRLGLVVATAVYVQPGFHGCLTLELVNDGDSPIRLTPGTRIAQLVVHRLEHPSPARDDDDQKYLAPVRPQASRLSSESEEFTELRALGEGLRSRLG